MPTKARDSVRKDALYPDELPGSAMALSSERLNGELQFWDAGDPDDAADLPSDGSADFGWWVPVEHGVHGEVWAAAPRALREQLLELELGPGDVFEVTDVMRGDEEHDPYELAVHESDPDGS